MSVFQSVKNWYSELAKPYEESDFIQPVSEIKESAESVTVTQLVELNLISRFVNGTLKPFIPNSVNLWWKELVKPYDESEFAREAREDQTYSTQVKVQRNKEYDPFKSSREHYYSHNIRWMFKACSNKYTGRGPAGR